MARLANRIAIVGLKYAIGFVLPSVYYCNNVFSTVFARHTKIILTRMTHYAIIISVSSVISGEIVAARGTLTNVNRTQTAVAYCPIFAIDVHCCGVRFQISTF